MITGSLAFAAAFIFQLLTTVLASLLTASASHGAPLPAGHASFMFFVSGDSDAFAQTINLALTTLVFVVPARRSFVALLGAALFGSVAFAGVVLALPDGEKFLDHVAWWLGAMLPVIAVGVMPRVAPTG